jgi:hypothetical protein
MNKPYAEVEGKENFQVGSFKLLVGSFKSSVGSRKSSVGSFKLAVGRRKELGSGNKLYPVGGIQL